MDKKGKERKRKKIGNEEEKLKERTKRIKRESGGGRG